MIFKRYIPTSLLAKLAILMLILFGGFLAYGQFSGDEFVVKTIHVFPANISAPGWNNPETLTFQNLDEYALLQEFNTINSATLNVSKNIQNNLLDNQGETTDQGSNVTDEIDTTDEREDETATASSTNPQTGSSTPATDQEVAATSSDEVIFDVVTEETPDETLESTADTQTTTTQQTVSDENTNSSSEETNEDEEVVEQDEAATTTVRRRVQSLFSLAMAAVTTVFDSASSTPEDAPDEETQTQTESLPESEDETEGDLEQEENVAVPASDDSPKGQQTASTSNTQATTTVPVTDTTATTTATTTQESPATTTPHSADEDQNDEDTAEDTTEEVASLVNDCVEDCVPYTITLSDFGFPLEENAELTGAQLRFSFAAEKKTTRDRVPTLGVEYSLNNGSSWISAGLVVIDDQVSNSVNGGYYLFALPEVATQASLDALQVRLTYTDNPEIVKNLYVESTWLELFTVEASKNPESPDFLAQLTEDGYQEGQLSGDELQLPSGKEIEFDFTDDNDGETLIIKTDEVTYTGLSEVTTYFSVTNTSNSPDDVTIQTYFPGGVGEVTTLSAYNQNKERSVTVPEYRPYVYHCEAGWESIGVQAPQTLEELSEQLQTADVLPEEIAPTAGSTEQENESAVATGTSQTIEPEVFDTATTSTTTVRNRLPSMTQLLLASKTASPLEPEVGSSTASSTVTVEEDTTTPEYICRNTNVVRACDELDGGNTACRMSQVKVKDHLVTKYAPGWDEVPVVAGEMSEPGFLQRVAQFVGFGPDKKPIPDEFEVRTHTKNTHTIAPGETRYFKMDISFPPFSNGEYWIEAIGKREYGLLDPFWSSDWSYRIPIQVDNSTGSAQTEYQVFMELDSTLSDFWANVNSDGSDIRFVQEVQQSNLVTNSTPAFESTFDPAWSDRIAFVVPAESLGASLSEFPVFVDLSTLGPTFWAGVASDGADIRITLDDGETEVPYDLVEIDTAAQTGELHFLAPILSNSAENVFHIYFNNPGASAYGVGDTYGRNAVWANYEAVYHFNEDPTVVSNVITDMTGNGKDLAVSVAALATTTGQIGTAVDFFGSSGILTDGDYTWTAGDEIISSGWYYQSAASSEAIWAWGTGNAHNFMPWYSGTTGYLRFGSTGGGTNYSFTPRVAGWHHFSTFAPNSTGTTMTVYEDTILRESSTQQVGDPSAGPLQIGRYTTGGSINAYLDELRFSTTTQSTDWIEAEYDNQNNPTAFYSTSTRGVGGTTVTGWYSTSWDLRQKISLSGDDIEEDIDDFPVYLDLSSLGAEFFAEVATDGRDIRVTAGDGMTELPIEVVNIDTGAMTGQIYFKADLVDRGANDFYIYYKNSDAAAYARDDTYGLENVWTNGFQAVYHLEEDVVGTGNSNAYLDSTSNRYHGDDQNISNGKYGLFGAGQEFGDSQTDYLSLPNDVMDGLTDNSVSWWHISSTTQDQTIVSGANSTQFNEFWARLDNNFQLVLYSQGGGESFNLSDTVGDYADNTWQYYLTTSQDDINEMNLYVNGEGDTENPDPQAIAALDIEPGGLIIGQDQDALGGNFSSAENFEGFLDELRFANVVRSANWAATVHANMADHDTFVATSSVESLSATEFVELDFWVQHFDDTAEEADIWVQVADMPVGKETVIYLYYGSPGATSASDEFATFTYSTSTDIYYVVDDSGGTNISVQSLIDGNEVSLDGGSAVSLDRGESTSFATFDGDSVISVLGPISGTVTGPSNDGSDMLAPVSFATTTFAIPTDRSTNRWYIHAPFASTTVRTYIGSSGTANQTFNILEGTAVTATADPADPGNGSDGDGVVIEASSPVLVTHRHTVPGDGLVAYPPTMRDIFGVDSQYIQLSATQNDPDPTIICSSGATAGLTGTTRGEKDDITQCTTGAESTGNAVRFSAQTEPIAAIQQADSDGNESTVFWPQHEFGTRYAMTNSSAYAAVVCSPRFGEVDLAILSAAGATLETGTCTPGATTPGKAYFNAGIDGDSVNYAAGGQVVATNGVPFYVIYEDVTVDQDEKNISGAVQARKFDGTPDKGLLFGAQEIANDTEYEQLSFAWYQNALALTPTSTWSIGGAEFVSEGEPITGGGAVDDGDVLRLRMNMVAATATGTAQSEAFALQYAAAATGQCSTATNWLDVGQQGSSTAAFSGYNNPGVADGSTLATTTLASSTVLGSYEERNFSELLVNEIPTGQAMEFDWVLQATNVEVNTNYCFRMVRANTSELKTYTLYPELETVGPPNIPLNFVFFDNERTTILTPELEFAATDIAGDDIHYRVQIDDDADFSSVIIDRNSDDNFTEFENVNVPSDKAPFTSGNRVRFSAGTTLSPTTTYWYRISASDPAGSATTSDWSVPFSFTTDTTLSVSEWFQTTTEQFETNELTNVTAAANAVSVSASPGTMVSTPIDFDSATIGNAWGEIDWSDTETSGDITMQVQYNDNGTWKLVPDSELTGNSAGITSAPINILGLDTNEYNQIRLVATFTGATLSLEDWVVRWGLRVGTPIQGDPFDNQKVVSTLPVFDFVSTDPQGDGLEYEISISTDINFSLSSSTFNSAIDPGFSDLSTGSTTSPFASGNAISYTTQSALSNGVTYWWRSRAKDPLGGNAWSPWSEPDAFTIDTGVTLSTWFQTTQEQFEQGVLDGTVASTSDSVESAAEIGEYGTTTISNNTWTLVNTNLNYNNMVVVASPEFTFNGSSNGRTPRVRNKTANSFEIKVDNYLGTFSGTTEVDYIVMEAGDWTVDDGGTGFRILAATESVSQKQAENYSDGVGENITISPAFSSNPVALATISSDNDSDWVATHIDGGTYQAEVTTTQIGLALAQSRHSASTHTGAEDVDYMVIDAVGGTVNGTRFQALNSADTVTHTGAGTSISGFASAPAVTVVHNNGDDGAQGGFAQKDLGGTNSNTSVFTSISEQGASADGHTANIVSIVAFENASGLLSRYSGSGLSGTIAGEDIIFSDGAGPKFDNFAWTATTPGASAVLVQMQYEVSEGVYALIPDTEIPGNSVGATTSPIVLTDVDINLYPTIRPFATLSCSGGDCPELTDWQLEWSEGVNMSGTLRQYDRATAVATGTIRVAVNGSILASQGTTTAGMWSVSNVAALPGDLVTVWVDGVSDAEEAVAAFVYDGLGDMTGVELFQRHLSFSADETGTTTSALLSLSHALDEDIFFSVDGGNNLTVCGAGSCADANIYIGPGNTYIPNSAGGVSVSTHDVINQGYIELDANVINVSGSWVSTATSSTDTATVNFTAATGTESISSIESPHDFHAVTFGSLGGSATYSLTDNIDLSGSLTVASGTLSRDGFDIALAGSLTTGAGGYWQGTGTTTFDGGAGLTWTDNNPVSQNIGNVVIDGATTFVTAVTDVRAYDITIGSNDTLAGSAGNTIFVGGDWTNTGTFTAGNGTVEIVNDDRVYPPVVPGSADWYGDTNFVDRVAIVVDDGEVPGDLTNFPLFVDLSLLGDDFWDDVQTDGRDIRVTSGDGQSELAIDLVEIDAVAKTGELHFLADAVSGSTSTTFYLYHNNPAASAYTSFATYGRDAVWAEYEAVYHFTDDPTSVSNVIVDATGNGNDLIVEGVGLATSTGQMGLAADMNSLAGRFRANGFRWATGTPLTTSGWYKMPAADNEALWQFGTGAQPHNLYFEPWDSGTTRGQYIFGTTGGTTYTFSPRDTVNWNHFTTLGATSTSESNYVYHNGFLRETQAQTIANPGNTNSNGLQIGRTGTGGDLDAEVDELRFAGLLRNTDWITAEYNNQDSPTTFYATTSVQTYVPDLVIDAPSHNISAGGSAFYNLTMDDATTSPAFIDASVVVAGDFTVATGTVALPTGVLTLGGSFLNSGYFMHNNAEIEFTSGSTATVTLNGTEFFNALFDVTFDGTGPFIFTDSNATSSGSVAIEDGTVVFPSEVFTIGAALTVSGGSFDANNGTVLFSSLENEVITTGGSSFADVVFGLQNPTAGWYSASWNSRIAVVVASTSVEAGVSEFPVYVNMAHLGDDFWDNIQTDARDVRMTSADGKTEIPVEIAEMNYAAKTGELHFLAPTLLPTVDTTFYVYIDNPAAEVVPVDGTYGRNAVWKNYEAVYHFAEDPVSGITDVSGNGRNLAALVGTPSTTVGQLGTALDTTSASVMVGESSWTWTPGDDLVSSGLYFMANTDTGALWQFGNGSGSNNGSYLAFMPNYDVTNRGRHFFGITSGAEYTVAPYNNSVWHHFTTNGRAADGADNEIYEDAQLQDVVTQITSSQNPTNTGLKIGRYQTGTYNNIQVDELRFATTTRSIGWITTEYNNFLAADSFYSTSSESYLAVVPSFTLDEPVTDVDGDVSIYFSNVVAPTSNFTIGGSALNVGGSYNPNNATTTFDSTDVGETVEFGDGAFYNLSFDGVDGGWLIATTTVVQNASLVTGADFTLAPNTTMSVSGIFSNSFASAATTWTDSTLLLNGGDYTVTQKSDAGDDYATLIVSGDSNLVMWNSTISTSSVRDTSSLYMPDYGNIDGELQIFGEYTRSTGNEYWNYATDFDGTDLSGGSERQAVVRVGRGSSIVLATSTTLEMKGIATASTTVSSLTGIYALTLVSATLDSQFTSVKNTGPDGLHLTNGTTITTLENTEFAVAGGRSGITVDAATINLQPSSEFTANIFGTSSANSIYEPAWTDQVVLTVQSSQVQSDLTEYPVYVNLANMGADFWSGVEADGADIRVTTDNGSELPIDVVEIDSGNQTGELHFLAPALYANQDVSFYIHFNNPAAVAYAPDDEFGAQAVWKNYEAVYHFEEDPSVLITDKSANGRNLNPSVGTAATTSGLFGTALDTTSANVMLANSTWTWTAGEDLVSSGLYFQSAFDTGALWEWGNCAGDDCIAFLPWYDNATRGYHRFGETSGNDYNFARNNAIWHHFTTIGRATDGEAVEIYEDNVLRDTYTQTAGGENPSKTGLKIGRYTTGTYMDIQVDELRFSTTTPSTGWINTEYSNFTSPETFYATSSAQEVTYNVRTDGVPTTFWLFSNGTGNIYGEAFDDDDGDPGSIQWDDSNFAVTISGVVYQDDGVTPASYPVCNGSSEVVTVVLDGVTTYTASCDPVDGSYEVTGIVYTGEPQITTYINSESSVTQTNVVVYDETTGVGTVSGNQMTVSRPTVLDETVLVLIAGKDDQVTFGTPAGWIAIDIDGDTNGDDLAAGVWYRVVSDAGTEPATYNFPVTDNGEEYNYWMGSLLNVDTVSPVDVSGSWLKYINNLTPEAPATSTVTNGAMAFSAWYVFNDSTVTPPIYNWQTRAQNVVGVGNNNLTVSSQRLETAGSTGSSTLTGVFNGRESYAIQFAIKPAASPTATGTMSAAAVTKTPIGNSGSPYETVTQRDQKVGFGTIGAGLDVQVNRPAVENGDVLVAIVAKEDDFTFTAPAGWVLAADRAETAGNDMYTGVWYKTITNAGAEPATYGFTNNDSGTEEYSYWIGSFDGVDTLDVFGGTPSWSNLQNTSSPSAPSVTPTRDGAFVLAAWYVIDDGAMNMPASPWITLGQDIVQGNRLLAVSGRLMETAVATGVATLTGGSTDDVNVGQFILRPAPVSVASSISDMDLYQNRVILRHEDIAPLSISDMSIFDNDDESDLPFTATAGAPDNLTVIAGNGLVVWNNRTFTPGGEIILAGVGATTPDGSVLLNENSTLTANGSDGMTVGGSFFAETGATYNGASSTITFTATNPGQQIGSAASSTLTFSAIDFTGVGGAWAVQTPIVSQTNIDVATGTLLGVSDITVLDGSLSGNGLVSMTDGTVEIQEANILGGTQAWTFNNLTLGSGGVAGVTTPAGSATTTVLDTLTVSAAHFLDAKGSVWDLAGDGSVFVENGTFIEGTSTVRFSGATPNVLQTPYYNLVIDTESGGSVAAIAPTTGLQVLNNLTIGALGTSTLDATQNDPLMAVGNDVYIGTLGTLAASDIQTLTVNGDWDNDGIFVHNNGTVTFSNTTAGATIAAGASSFANLNVLGSTDYTFTQSATATADMTITTGTFTLDPGRTLAIGGQLLNTMSDVNTTWTGTTLRLFGGASYLVNPKSVGDTYNIVEVSQNTHPRFWNSTSSVITTESGSSLYSMDHDQVDGDLHIYGDFVNTTFDDYWDYTRDWDGAVLGVPRQASVYIENAGTVLYAGGLLSAVGTSTASTSIAALTGGTYQMTIGGDTEVSLDHYVVRDTTIDGLIFTGSPDITDISRGDIEVAIAGGSAMTVGASAINANQARNFTNNRFATTTAINAFNVTATGSAVSSWRFVNVDGNLDGEAKDIDPGGDPGYIVWEDSAAIINITGRVYGDEGVTVSAVCDGSTNNIWLSIQGLTFASTTCAAGTGEYTFTGIGYGPSDTLTVYIDGETEKAATVTKDPISSIGNMDLYENRVIVRHESAGPQTIAAMSVWDSSDDADIPFTAVDAATDTLTLPADFKLIVWTDKEFAPAGNVVLAGGGVGDAVDGTLELYDDASFTADNGQSHSIGGDMLMGVDSVFTPAQSQVTFTSAAGSRTIDTNETGFYDISFTGAGAWTLADTELIVANDVSISAGVVTLPAATSTVFGSFTNSGGSFVANGGLLQFAGSGAGKTIQFGGSDAHTVTFIEAGSWTMSDVNATTTNSFTVATGTVTLPSGILSVTDDFVVRDTVVHNSGTIRLLGALGGNVLTLNGNDLSSVRVVAGVGDYTLTDASAALLDDITIESGSFTAGTGTLAVGGSFDAVGGTFVHSSGTVLFNSSNTGELIDSGQNDFYNVVVAGAGGGWTILDNATTTNNFSLTLANDFTLSTGTILYVGNVFQNTVGGAATTWQGSTLVLDGGTMYETNTKTTPVEQYNSVIFGENTDVSSWNSAATSTVVATTSSWYSQDHAGTDGSLYIFGDYHIGTTTEYWSQAVDFDGVVLGAPRAVSVAIASSSLVILDGGTLEIIGTAAATTTINNQGAGRYDFLVTSGTLNAEYYSLRNLSASGLQLLGNTTITSLSNGDFELAQDNAVAITLASTTLNANASLSVLNTRFAAGGFSSGVNVSLDATTTNSWLFTGALGDLWGEAFDVDGVDACSSIRWDDSACLLTEQTTYRWRNDDGGEGATPGSWFNPSWDARKRVRVVNEDALAYTDTAVKLSVAYDSDMQTDFEDLRFTDAGGTTTIDYWIERFTTGNEADVWVRVPSMLADSVTEIYMYYGNVSATSSEDISEVFVTAEDFEDNDISDYSGDLVLFNTAGTFAYGGGFGLDTAGNESAKATDGIARGLTVSQGNILRYMQYVDTTAGSGDEVCTMFAVQGAVTNNQNYAVCLEQFGTDRVSLVKDVENTDSTGTVLASSTITLSTGWYEVEVDWQTNDTMDVSVFSSDGTLRATTSATDSSYASGGIGFTFWFQNGGWDSYVSWPRTDTKPKTYFGAEQEDGGASFKAPQDTPTGGYAFGETARLRIGIENTGLPIENQNFRLEFAPKLTAPSCEAVSPGAFAAVPAAASCGASAICMTTSSSTADGDPTTDNLITAAGAFSPGEIVTDPSNQTANIDVDQNRYTELEYALNLTVNASNDAYCFRVTDAGSSLDSYSLLPELTLAFDPQLDTVTLNDGIDISLTPGATTTVIASTTVTDLNGVADLVSATTTFYKTSATAGCTPDNNNCYIASSSSCSFTACTATSCTLQCAADFQFHADATDADGGEEWFAFMEVSDASGSTDFDTSMGVELLTLRALEVQNAIGYGTVDVNQNTGTFNPSTSVLNIGNEAIDVQIAGTDMTDGVTSVIPATQQVFATSTFDYAACVSCNTLSVTGVDVEVDLSKPTVDTPPVSDDIYWGIEVPFGTASNPHSGVNTFTAISD